MVVRPRLAIVTSHAIQYQIPLFRVLARALDLHVFFAQRQSPGQQADAGFGVAFEWDLDLFEGYEHTFLANRARLPSTQSYSGCDTPEIGQHIESGRFDAVMTMGWYLKSYVQAVRACKRLGLPVMVRGDSTLQAQKSIVIRAAKATVFPSLIRRFDAFLVVGKRSKSYLERYGVTEDRMFWSPHAVDNDRFAAGVREACHTRNVDREDLECQPDEFVVLFVGRFVSFKRPLDMVAALSSIGKEGIRVRGVFVGSGQLGEEIRLASKRFNVPIALVGFKNQSELPAIYAAADILILPSSGQETWGLVVNEAMACGTPAIVSSDVGCTDDLIEAGETGYQYPVGDVDALARSIRKLLPISGSDRVRRALEQKMSAYSLDRAVDGIVEAAHHDRRH
jgi:glycosyltransferase involved in cell wall biosynthesis